MNRNVRLSGLNLNLVNNCNTPGEVDGCGLEISLSLCDSDFFYFLENNCNIIKDKRKGNKNYKE